MTGRDKMPPIFQSASCGGERCSMCGAPAAMKLGEEIMHDDPRPERHNWTAYVCREHGRWVLFGERPALPEMPEPYEFKQRLARARKSAYQFREKNPDAQDHTPDAMLVYYADSRDRLQSENIELHEEIEERADSERNLIDLQEEQHQEITSLRAALDKAQRERDEAQMALLTGKDDAVLRRMLDDGINALNEKRLSLFERAYPGGVPTQSLRPAIKLVLRTIVHHIPDIEKREHQWRTIAKGQ